MTQPATGAGMPAEGFEARREGSAVRKFYGLVELNTEGTVLYARVDPDDVAPPGVAPDYSGLNFFTQVAPFGNVAEFRGQLDSFSRGSLPTHSVDFTCDYEDGPVPVRLLFTRIRERSETDVSKSILVHIRRA